MRGAERPLGDFTLGTSLKSRPYVVPCVGFFLWSKDRWYKDTVHRTQIISTIIHQNGPNNHDILVPDELSFPMMYDT